MSLPTFGGAILSSSPDQCGHPETNLQLPIDPAFPVQQLIAAWGPPKDFEQGMQAPIGKYTFDAQKLDVIFFPEVGVNALRFQHHCATNEDAGNLCRGLARCSQSVIATNNDPRATLVKVSVLHDPAIPPSEFFCDEGEYWWVQGSRTALIAKDCAAQWGADGRAPLTISLKNKKIRLQYTAHIANDQCDRLEVELLVPDLSIVQYHRYQGEFDKNRCQHWKRWKVKEKHGTGAADSPLVQAHREWGAPPLPTWPT